MLPNVTISLKMMFLIITLSRFLSCHIPHLPRHLALLASLLRVVFLPLFLFCNLAPRWSFLISITVIIIITIIIPSDRLLTPILLNSDLAYCLLMMALAVSNGYLTRFTILAIMMMKKELCRSSIE